MTKLLIVDDHPMILEGSKKLFSDEKDIDVDTLHNIEVFEEVIENTKYDIFLIDINLGETSGIALAEIVRAKMPNAIVILYTGHNIEDYYSLIIDRKIDNILSKTATKDKIIRTIHCAINREALLPDHFLDYVTRRLNGNRPPKALRLNIRQKKILQFVVDGHTNHAIAAELGIPQRTIENNLSQIFALLNVTTRTEAVVKAKELELI